MFETPTIDIQEIRSTVTEAGNTAAGFVVLAAKRANDMRLDATSRYSTQINEFRKQALVVVNKVESVRVDMEAAVEPTIAKVIDRLPAPAAKVATQAQEAVKSFQAKAHDMVVDALTVDAQTADAQTAASARTAARTAARSADKRTAKSKAKAPVAKAAAAKAVKAVRAAKPVARKAIRTSRTAVVAGSKTAARAAKSSVKPAAARNPSSPAASDTVAA